MGDRHKNRILAVRPDDEARDSAQAVLDQDRLKMQEFITACLAALAADPEGMLNYLARYWPPPRRSGRQRKL